MIQIPEPILGALSGLASKAASAASSIVASLDAQRKRRTSYIPSREEQVVLARVQRAVRVRETQMLTYGLLWTRCILFLAGLQHLRYVPLNNSFQNAKKRNDWQPFPVFNKIQPRVERIIDFFTRHDPTATVEPKDHTEMGRLGAEVGETVREYLWSRNESFENLDECASWLVTTGNTFIRVYLDSRQASMFRMPKYTMTREPLMDLDGQPLVNFETGELVSSERYQLERGPNGEVLYEERPQPEVNECPVGPLAMTVPLLGHAKLSDSPWLMETSIQPLTSMRDLFPDMAQYLPEKGSVMTSDLYQHRLASLIHGGLGGASRALDTHVMEDHITANYYEEAPTNDFPNGLAVVESDGLPLMIGELPLGKQFSWVHCGYRRVPGRFWYRGVVEDLISPQEMVNSIEQFLQVNDQYQINPKWLVPTSSGIPVGKLSNRPGGVYRYTYPFKPEPVDGRPMPPQIIQRRAIYEQDMDEMSNLRAVLQGQNPVGVTAGVALNRLSEEAEGAFGPVQKRWERFIERKETLKLEAVQRWYDTPRLIALRKNGQVIELRDFMGADLRGSTSVKIEAGSYRPRSKAAQQQIHMDLMATGLLPGVMTDPEQARMFLKIMGVTEFDPPESLDTRKAKWENEMLARSSGWEQVHRESGEDDVIHLMVHTNRRKEHDWRRMPGHVQMRHLMHEIEHLEAIMVSEGFGQTTNIEPDPAIEPGPGPGPEDPTATSDGSTGDPEAQAQEGY